MSLAARLLALATSVGGDIKSILVSLAVKFDKTGGTVTGDINLTSDAGTTTRFVTHSRTGDTNARVSLGYASDGVAHLKLSDGTASQAQLSFSANKVFSLGDGAIRTTENPASSDDLVRKGYIDSLGIAPDTMVSWENRATLRAMTPTSNQKAWVESLGVFVYTAGSDALDDDETCFRLTGGGGSWLLRVPDMDLIMAYRSRELDELQGDIRVSIADQFSTRFTAATFNQTSSLVTSGGRVTINSTVTGATLGTYVIVCPPSGLSADVSFYGYVSATDTITVAIVNMRSSTTSIPTGNWPVLLINMN